MSKVKRVIRKSPPTRRGDFFDESQWPVTIAMVILGAFLIGVTSAYLPFLSPTWYRSGLFYIGAIVLVVLGYLIGFRYVDNRAIRRTMQLSAVLCALFHVVLVVYMQETKIFGMFFDSAVVEREIIESRTPKVVAEYRPQEMIPDDDDAPKDFEKPVEVATPEPTTKTTPDRPTEEPPTETRPKEQPIPVQEQTPTAKPNIVRREESEQAAPKQAEQTSKLSRQIRPSQMKTSNLAELPKMAEKMTGEEAKPKSASVQRQTAEAANSRSADVDSAMTTPAETARIAKKTDTATEKPTDTSVPTLKRAIATPNVAPKAIANLSESPSQTRKTEEETLKPATTLAAKRQTESPETQPNNSAEPVVDISARPSAQMERRESPAEAAASLAQAPSAANNQRAKLTERPDTATMAAIPKQDNTASSAASELKAASSAVQKSAAAQVSAAKMSDVPSNNPTTPDVAQPSARAISKASNDAPQLNTTDTQVTRTQKGGAPSLPGASRVDVAVAAPSTSEARDNPSPAASNVQKQAVAAAEKGVVAGEPAAAQVASANSALSEMRPSPKRQTTTEQPRSDLATLGQAGPNVPGARAAAARSANLVTQVADVPSNTGPRVQGDAIPGPSTALVRRQEGASSPAATRMQTPAETESAATTTQLARSQVGGASSSANAPSIDPQATAGNRPKRAVLAASGATSPSQIESPAVAQANAGSGDVSAPSARMALSKSLAGTAGAGRSPNLNDASPGASGQATVASSAAKRVEATQQSPDGSALTPSAPASLARSRSESSMPSSSRDVRITDLATQAGSNSPSEMTASSSAALTKADSNARKGNSTGAAGSGDIDFGPTQVVSEAGTGRAAGGGQAELNFATQSPLIAKRSTTGGAPAMSLAGAKVDTSVAAPMGTDGGAPGATSVNPMALAATRTVAGGSASTSGGPSRADQVGPAMEVNGAALAGPKELSRADNSAGAAASAGGGDAGLRDQKASALQLARQASGGGPQLAISGPTVAELAVSPMGAGGDAGGPSAESMLNASAAGASRQSLAGGATVGGANLAAGGATEPGTAGGGELVGSLAIARAELADGVPGPAAIGGGTGKPSRAASGPSVAADVRAETVELAGQMASAGSSDGSLIEASGGLNGRLAGGARGAPTSGASGAIAGDQVLEGTTTGLVGRGLDKRQGSNSSETGPAIADNVSGGPPGRAGMAQAAGATGLTVDLAAIGPNAAVTQATMDHMLGGLDGKKPMTKASGDDALVVDVSAVPGPGGLGNIPEPEVGIKTRQARTDSDSVQVASARFIKASVGGLPNFSSGTSIPTAGFSGRAARKRGDMPAGGRGRPDPKTEESVELGLAFLARHQSPEGSWSLQGFDDAAPGATTADTQYLLVSDTGATALCLISFQGAGYTHRDHQYKDVVRKGLEYLVKNQKENGDLFVALDNESNKSVWLYSHALATLALCEAYGMTQDPDLKEPAQKAIDFIVKSQNTSLGGWRYSPGVDSDTSVSGWMLMALKSGRLANLNVPKETFDKVARWLDLSQKSGSEPHLFRYNPYAPDTLTQRHGRVPSKTMTSVGLLMRLHTGWRRDNPAMIQGAEYLRQNLPSLGTARDPQRDTYYWYYSTQVMFHMDGKYWEDWKGSLQPLLRESQVRSGVYAGSWHPQLPIPDRWAPHAGRLYVTTMNLLSLEVEYRHLPLYEDTKQ